MAKIDPYKSINSSYDTAIQTYTQLLPQLQGKYNALLTQLQNEQNTAQAQQTQQFGTEKTSLTANLAKRGITAKAGDQFFDTEQGKLSQNQGVQAQDLLNKYQSQRLGVTTAQTQDEAEIKQAIAGLNTERSNKLIDLKNADRTFKLQKEAQKFDEKKWKKEYKAARSDADRDYLLKLKELNKNSGKDSQANLSGYLDDLRSAASGDLGFAPNLRENIRDKAIAAGISKDVAQKYMEMYLPNGWEWNTRNPNSLK